MMASRVGVIARPSPSLPSLPGTVRFYLVMIVTTTIVSGLVVAGTGRGALLRLVLALLIALVLITLSLARPAAGVVATFVYLVFMAFLRRLLIPAADWISFDPLLLVAPTVALVLLVKLFVLERRRLAPDLLSKLMLVLVILTFVEVANPLGDGVKANLVGLLFTATPLFWFFVGREVLDDRLIDGMFGLIIVLAIVSAAYGLYQTQVGYPSWDQNWLSSTGFQFSSLNVGGKLRGIGPFSSFWEYGLFLGSALAAAVAFVIRGRLVAILAVPPLAVALFLASNRSGLIMSALAVVVMLAVRTRRPVVAALIAVCAIGGAYGGLKLFSSTLSGAAASSASALVSHQLAGLSDPTNSQDSTLLIHLNEVKSGVFSSIHHPLGIGPGATNNASGVNQQSSLQDMQTTEVDISNAFVEFGPAGGALYILIVLLVLGKAILSYFRLRDAMLPVIGLLVVGAGQWLTGGHYALSPLTWLFVGAVASRGLLADKGQRQLSPNGPPLWQRPRRAATS